MKRVTLLVVDAEQAGDELRIEGLGPDGCIYVRGTDVLAVEDAPDPLPREPGERFWGRRANDAAQWWYVTWSERRGCIQYAPTLLDYWCDPIEATEVEALGLKRVAQ